MLSRACRTVESFSGNLDFIRSRLLRLTMKVQFLRPLFQVRAIRLGFLFLFSCTFALSVSLAFPLWALLLGPLIYGVPHIFSSMRYFHYLVARRAPGATHLPATLTRQGLFLVGSVLLILFGYRLFVTLNVLEMNLPQLSEWKGSTYLELMAMGLTFLIGIFLYRLPTRGVFTGAFLLLPFFIAFILQPVWTVGAMVLIHNFIAFAYWIRGARDGRDRSVAIGALLATLGLTVAIFQGTFDAVYSLMQPHTELGFAHLSVAETGALIAPWAAEATQKTLWLHACTAFAFGQMLHYFVWLKAIPDQFHYHETPTSFRQSLKLLERDFGKTLMMGAIAITLGTWLLWSLLSLVMARLVYFALASYHGYLEIAGLALACAPDSLDEKESSI